MKIVVFGNGSIGKRHLRNLQSLGIKDLFAMDPSAERRKEVEGLFPGIKTYASEKELFAQEKIEVAFICSPPQFHMSQLEVAIDHGAHCFVEKPFSVKSESIKPILQKADQKKIRVMTGFNMRYVDQLKKLKKLIDDGKLGRILSLRMGLSSYMPMWHPWEDYRKCFMAFDRSGGGALYDYVHGVDLSQWLLSSDIKEVSCIKGTTSLEIESDDMAMLIGRTKSGVLVSLYFDFVDHINRRGVDVIGTEGTAIWSLDTEGSLKIFSKETRTWEIDLQKWDYNTCYVDQIKEFLQCLKEGKELASDGWNGLNTQEVLDMAVKSNQLGVKVAR